MKVLKIILATLGLAGLIAGGVYLAWTAIDVNRLLAVANANRSATYPSPMNRIYLLAGLASLGALLLGLGIGLPSMTAGGIRKRALDAAAADTAAIHKPVVVEREVVRDPAPAPAPQDPR